MSTARSARLHHVLMSCCFFFFFFNDTATTEIYTLSLHDALPIRRGSVTAWWTATRPAPRATSTRSEEHTSELQSRENLVCRLLLEKKKKNKKPQCAADANTTIACRV